jgi:outer membrane murein-binding lipoprotein Lpp
VLSLVVTASGRQPTVALAATEGGPDSGRLIVETNQKLDQVNSNLKELNSKMQELLDLLKGGKVEVVAKDNKAARPVAANETSGSQGTSDAGR